MAGQQDSPMTLTAGGTVSAFRLGKLSSGQVIHNTETYSDEPICVTQESGVAGDALLVRDIKQGGTHKVTAAGAITAGADIYAADAGKVQALKEQAGTYLKIGKALEQTAAADGDIIEVWLDPTRETTTVSS